MADDHTPEATEPQLDLPQIDELTAADLDGVAGGFGGKPLGVNIPTDQFRPINSADIRGFDPQPDPPRVQSR